MQGRISVGAMYIAGAALQCTHNDSSIVFDIIPHLIELTVLEQIGDHSLAAIINCTCLIVLKKIIQSQHCAI